MTATWQKNIWIYYLPPHTSHVLQPLDLSVFKFVKNAYRDRITDLASIEDSAPIKKIRFIQYYQHAREIGLSSSHIISSWLASGIVPWNPRKVITSHWVTQNAQASTTVTNEAPFTSKTPRDISIDILHTTPRNSRAYRAQVDRFMRTQDRSRTARILFSKVSKRFDSLEFNLASTQLQLQKAQKVINDIRVKRRRKVTIDANKAFVELPDILATQEALEARQAESDRKDRAAEARAVSERIVEQQMQPFMQEWHVLDKF